MKRLAARAATSLPTVCLLGIALWPSLGSAQAILHAGIVGSEIHVGVTVYWIDMPAQYTGVVVQRWTDGLCDDHVTVTPAPCPRETRPPFDPASNYSFAEPLPGTNHCFGYVVRAVDAEGGLHAVEGAGEMPFDYVAVGAAIVSRGTLAFNIQEPSSPLFTACAEGCWETGLGGQIDVQAVDPASWQPFLNQGIPLDIYGEIYVSDLLPSVLIVASQIIPTSSGQCGPVPVQPISWGQVKTIYR